jgi:hypothetical protein
MQSPCFSSFRDLLDRWDNQLKIKENIDSINNIFDKHELILFFKKGDDYFGAPEDSRVIFAKLKTDTEDDPMMPGFRQEARFPAINLAKIINDDPENSTESVFSIRDLPKINVCSREDAIDNIMKFAKKKSKKK